MQLQVRERVWVAVRVQEPVLEQAQELVAFQQERRVTTAAPFAETAASSPRRFDARQRRQRTQR